MPDIMEIDDESQAALDKAFDEIVTEDKGAKADPNAGGSENVTITSAAGAELHVDAGSDDDDDDGSLDPETPPGEAKKKKTPKADPTDASVAAAKTAEEEAEKVRVKANAEAAAKAKEAAKAAGATDEEDEVDKLKIGRGASQADKDGWNALKQKAKERKQAAKDATARAEAAEAKAAELEKTGPLSKEQLDRLEALERFEFMHDPEKSGVVTREFDAKLAASQAKFIEILQAEKVPQSVIDEIAEKGLGAGDVNAWISDIDKGKLPPATKERLKGLLLLHDDTKQQRQAKIAEAAGDRTKFEGTKKEAHQKAIDQHVSTYRNEMARLCKEAGFEEKPETGTKEEIAAAKENNVKFKALSTYHDDLSKEHDTGPAGMAKLLFNATKSKDFEDYVIPAKNKEIAAEKSRADKAEAELAKIKGASRLSRAESPEPPKPKKATDSVGTLDDNFNEIVGKGE